MTDLIVEARGWTSHRQIHDHAMSALDTIHRLADRLEAAERERDKQDHDRKYWRRRYQTMHQRAKLAEVRAEAAEAKIAAVKEVVETEKRFNLEYGCDDVPVKQVLVALQESEGE